jgi:segregation and condensation protein B
MSPSSPSDERVPVQPFLTSLERAIEAILFIASKPVSTAELSEVTGSSTASVETALLSLRSHYEVERHGLALLALAGGWQMVTSSDLEEMLLRFRDVAGNNRVRLSKAALETLAVIAYNQPVTRSEIEEIRGVRSDRVVETLLGHGLIRVAGRKKGTGTPLLYRTTDRFMELFGLYSIADLPSREELEDELVNTLETTDGASTFAAESEGE